jgi:hypothetical protein
MKADQTGGSRLFGTRTMYHYLSNSQDDFSRQRLFRRKNLTRLVFCNIVHVQTEAVQFSIEIGESGQAAPSRKSLNVALGMTVVKTPER